MKCLVVHALLQNSLSQIQTSHSGAFLKSLVFPDMRSLLQILSLHNRYHHLSCEDTEAYFDENEDEDEDTDYYGDASFDSESEGAWDASGLPTSSQLNELEKVLEKIRKDLEEIKKSQEKNKQAQEEIRKGIEKNKERLTKIDKDFDDILDSQEKMWTDFAHSTSMLDDSIHSICEEYASKARLRADQMRLDRERRRLESEFPMSVRTFIVESDRFFGMVSPADTGLRELIRVTRRD